MEDTHKEKLRTKTVEIVTRLNVNAEFMARLVQAKIFSCYNEEDVMVHPGKHDRNREFLNILYTRGPNAYQEFMTALVTLNQDYLASMIDPELTAKLKEEHGLNTEDSD